MFNLSIHFQECASFGARSDYQLVWLMMLIPYIHIRHLISLEIKAFHVLEYTRRRIWGLTAATALQHSTRSTGWRRKLGSICCKKTVCRWVSCEHTEGNLAPLQKSLLPLVWNKSLNEPSSVLVYGSLQKLPLQMTNTWTLHAVLGDQVSTDTEGDVIVTFKPKTQTGFWLDTSLSRCFVSSCDYHQSLSHGTYTSRPENALT